MTIITMKKLFLPLLALACMLMSCSDDDTVFNNPDTPAVENGVTRTEFAEDDGKKVLSGAPNVQARLLMNKVPADYIAEMTDTLGRANITPEEYAEIQAFTKELTAGLTTQKDKYTKCFNWVVQNIKYVYEYVKSMARGMEN